MKTYSTEALYGSDVIPSQQLSGVAWKAVAVTYEPADEFNPERVSIDFENDERDVFAGSMQDAELVAIASGLERREEIVGGYVVWVAKSSDS